MPDEDANDLVVHLEDILSPEALAEFDAEAEAYRLWWEAVGRSEFDARSSSDPARPRLRLVPDPPSKDESALPPSSTAPPTADAEDKGFELDERWREAANRLDEMIAVYQEQLQPLADFHFDTSTLLDVLVEPPSPYCERAPKFARLDRRNRKFVTWVGRCKKGGCSRCLPSYLHEELCAFLHYFEFADRLWRTEFPDKAEWRRFSKTHSGTSKAFFQQDGTVIAFSTTTGNKQVPALRSLLEALLGTEAHPGKRKRHSQIPKRRKMPADPLKRTVPVARRERVEDVKLRASDAVGGEGEWQRQIHKPRSKTDVSHTLPELRDDHFAPLDGVLDGVKRHSDAEFAEMLLIARLRRDPEIAETVEVLNRLR